MSSEPSWRNKPKPQNQQTGAPVTYKPEYWYKRGVQNSRDIKFQQGLESPREEWGYGEHYDAYHEGLRDGPLVRLLQNDI